MSRVTLISHAVGRFAPSLWSRPLGGHFWTGPTRRATVPGMRMADAHSPDLVVGGVESPAADPPGVDTAPHFPDDMEPLCRDVPIGRVVSLPHPSLPVFAATYLALDIDIAWRRGRRVLSEHHFRMSGVFLVLATQVRVRPLTRRGKPFRFEPDFGQFGDPRGPWPLARFQPESGVDLADLLRLADLARHYDRNLIKDADGPPRVRFIPVSVERELRWIAHRLASNTSQGQHDFCE